MTDTIQRRLPRLSFAGRPAPRLETGNGSWEVVDLCADGVRVRSAGTNASMPTIGDILRGTILFPADRAVIVSGRVLRVGGGEVALCLAPGAGRLANSVPVGPSGRRRVGLLW